MTFICFSGKILMQSILLWQNIYFYMLFLFFENFTIYFDNMYPILPLTHSRSTLALLHAPIFGFPFFPDYLRYVFLKVNFHSF